MTLSTYLESYLGTTLTNQLNWSTSGSSFDFIVEETLSTYGVSSELEATNLPKLHAIAKVKLWEAVLREFSFDFDYTDLSSSIRRSQVFENIQKQLNQAISSAYQYLPQYKIRIGKYNLDKNDPYSNTPYSDRTV
jgi:hypothetical protein